MADPPAPAQPRHPAPPADVASDVVLYCPACMYDLRGSTADTCPECGAPLDREQLAKSSIPWVHRDGLGVRAFLQTAYQATFKTEPFCTNIARPVSLTDARKFRRKIVAVLTIVCLMLSAVMLRGAEDLRDPMERLWHTTPLLMGIASLYAVIALWLFVLAITGLHLYWLHPKSLPIEQQNRAVAIGHYACSPLLGLVPAAVMFGLALVLAALDDTGDSGVLMWIGVGAVLIWFVLTLLSIVAYLSVCSHMARSAAHRSGLASVSIWLGLPVLWLAVAAILFGVLPLALLYLYLMIISL